MITPPNYQKDAIPTPQGWRHPRSGELLVCMKISKEAINEHLGVSPEPQMLKESPTNFQEAKTELLTQSVDWDLLSLGRTHGIELDRRKTKADIIVELKEALY
jgi:hypothetical protein